LSRVACIAWLAVTCTNHLAAQARPTPASLPRSSFAWTQQQREVGFAHWDEVFPSRVIKRGTRVHALPAGAPLPVEGLEQFIAEQKVAGILVLHDGKVRIERYALGYGETGRWVSQSVAKSVTSTLVGAAIRDGFIASLDDPVSKYVQGLVGSAYDSVTIRQLMLMRSGVQIGRAHV